MLNILSDDILHIIYKNIIFNNYLQVRIVNKYIKNSINNYQQYNIKRNIFASNYIKFWWLSLKYKKDYILCLCKNNKLKNCILMYTSKINYSYNPLFNQICKKYNNINNNSCLIKYFNKIFHTNNKQNYKNYNKNILLDIHPYMFIKKKFNKQMMNIVEPSIIFYINLDYILINPKDILFNPNINDLKKILFT